MKRVFGLCMLAALAMIASNALAQFEALEQDPTVRELKRRALAREQENSFCSRSGWPTEPEADRASRFVWYDRAIAGYAKAFIDQYYACMFLKVDAVVFEGDRRCLRTTTWLCVFNKDCRVLSDKGCRKGNAYEWGRG